MQGDAPGESEDAASQDAVQAAEPEAEAPAAAEPEVPAGAELEARAGAESEDPAAAAAADNPRAPDVVILEEYNTAELALIEVFKKNWEVRGTDNHESCQPNAAMWILVLCFATLPVAYFCLSYMRLLRAFCF